MCYDGSGWLFYMHGRVWGGKQDVHQRRLGGSGGMVADKFLKFRSPEMPFPEAISSSYLIQVFFSMVIIWLHT